MRLFQECFCLLGCHGRTDLRSVGVQAFESLYRVYVVRMRGKRHIPKHEHGMLSSRPAAAMHTVNQCKSARRAAGMLRQPAAILAATPAPPVPDTHNWSRGHAAYRVIAHVCLKPSAHYSVATMKRDTLAKPLSCSSSSENSSGGFPEALAMPA